jgi:mannose-6-phosphate isomerase-like protein (cupin superfamily)
LDVAWRGTPLPAEALLSSGRSSRPAQYLLGMDSVHKWYLMRIPTKSRIAPALFQAMANTTIKGLGLICKSPLSKEKEVSVTYVARPDEDQRLTFPGAYSVPIFNEANTPVDACCAMFNIFFSEEYPQPGVHADNEGFYVISGHGKMAINGAEYELEPGCAMYAPAGVPHALKKVGAEDLHVFLYHFPK